MKKQKGFTLIETVVYIALFAILMGGAVAVAYTVFESAGHNQGKETMQQEGDFLIGKIEWALSSVQTITLPLLDFATQTQSSILQVTKYDGSNVTVSLNGNNMQLQKDADIFSLNNSNVEVSNLIFTREAASGGGINPESVSASFTLTTRTENGMLINQIFSTTKYLRK
jgi:prepilin-type N-terminal cleavage/methylation domain-containing protein